MRPDISASFDQEVRASAAPRSVCWSRSRSPLRSSMLRTAGAGRWLACGEPLDLGLHVGVGRRQPFLLGDGLEEERAAHGFLRAGPQLFQQLLVVPGHPVGVHPLPPHVLARVLDPVAHLPQHERLGHLEGMPAPAATPSPRPRARAGSPARAGPRGPCGARPRSASSVSNSPTLLAKSSSSGGQHLLLDLDRPSRCASAALPRSVLAAVVVGELTRVWRAPPARQPDDRLVDLGQHGAGADQEAVAGLGCAAPCLRASACSPRSRDRRRRPGAPPRGYSACCSRRCSSASSTSLSVDGLRRVLHRRARCTRRARWPA